MSAVQSKRALKPNEQDQAAKRQRVSGLPAGFFENENGQDKPENAENSERDEEWERFQQDINKTGHADAANSSRTVSERPNRPVISTYANPDNYSGAVIESAPVLDGVEPEVIETNTEQIETIEDDADEVAEALLDEFDIQEELFSRVEKMKQLRERLRERIEQEEGEDVEEIEEAGDQANRDGDDLSNSSELEDSEDETLWRSRAI